MAGADLAASSSRLMLPWGGSVTLTARERERAEALVDWVLDRIEVEDGLAVRTWAVTLTFKTEGDGRYHPSPQRGRKPRRVQWSPEYGRYDGLSGEWVRQQLDGSGRVPAGSSGTRR